MKGTLPRVPLTCSVGFFEISVYSRLRRPFPSSVQTGNSFQSIWRVFVMRLTLAFALVAFSGISVLAGPIMWIDDDLNRIGTVDVGTGVVNVIGPSGAGLDDIAFDPFGNLWGI